MNIDKARQHFVNKEEEIANTYMSASGGNTQTDYEQSTGMTLQGHKNKVIGQLIVGGVIIFVLYRVLKKVLQMSKKSNFAPLGIQIWFNIFVIAGLITFYDNVLKDKIGDGKTIDEILGLK